MIAYVCSSVCWGGLEMNHWRHSKWMKERGHRVIVFGIKNSPLHHHCLISKIPFQTIRKHKKHYDLGASLRLLQLFRKHNIKQVIVRDEKDIGVCTMVKVLRFGKLKIHYFMDMQLGKPKRNIAQTLRFNLLNTWIVPLYYLKEQTSNYTRVSRRKIHLIPMAIELSQFESEISQQKARKELQLPENKIIIGIAGRIDKNKGQLLVLQALIQLNDSNIHVAILGEPTVNSESNYLEELVKFVEANDLYERVHFRPFMLHHVYFYKAIDLFILGSTPETFGMVTVEAMASGTVVIGSNAGGTPELLEFGKIGYLFESKNLKDLVNSIRSHLTNPNKFSVPLLQESVQKFDHHQSCTQFEKLLSNN